MSPTFRGGRFILSRQRQLGPGPFRGQSGKASAGGGGAEPPPDFENLAHWYSSLNVDGSDNSTLSDGDDVSTWTDLGAGTTYTLDDMGVTGNAGGNGPPSFQTETLGTQPSVLFNSAECLSTDAIGTQFVADPAWQFLFEDFSIYFVWGQTTALSGRYLFDLGGTLSNAGGLWFRTDNGTTTGYTTRLKRSTNFFTLADSTAAGTDPWVVSPSSWNMTEFHAKYGEAGDDVEIIGNDGDFSAGYEYASDPAAGEKRGGCTLGGKWVNAGGGNFWLGHFGQFLCYNVKHDAATRLLVRAWLRDIYAVESWPVAI